jgi:hypothetical protein
MKYLKLYEQFKMIFENIDGIDRVKTDNKLFNSFGSKEKIQQCIEEVFTNQNLKYLGAGGVGLTFQLLESPELPEDFYKNSFEGKKCNTKMKCMKMTVVDSQLQEDEVNSARKLLNKDLKGICGYYWIKGHVFEGKKVYFICMDFLKLLDVKEKMIAHLIFNLYYPTNGAPSYWLTDTDNRLNKVFSWIKESSKSTENSEYLDDEFIKSYKIGIKMANVQGLIIDSSKKVPMGNWVKMFCDKDGNEDFEGQYSSIKQYWSEMDESFFISFAKKLLEIYKIGTNAGLTSKWHDYKGPDLQENNLGYKGSELVGFDFT